MHVCGHSPSAAISNPPLPLEICLFCWTVCVNGIEILFLWMSFRNVLFHLFSFPSPIFVCFGFFELGYCCVVLAVQAHGSPLASVFPVLGLQASATVSADMFWRFLLVAVWFSSTLFFLWLKYMLLCGEYIFIHSVVCWGDLTCFPPLATMNSNVTGTLCGDLWFQFFRLKTELLELFSWFEFLPKLYT